MYPEGGIGTMHAGINRLKTWILIAALGGLFVLIGGWIGGTGGAEWALGIALIFNFAMYWFSDKIAIATTRSRPVTEQQYPELYRIVRELTALDHLPMPKIYVSEMMQPNAFATGRNPRHASVAVTQGILQVLDDRELRGVLAHELSHVRNHDILISSIAAGIGMSITFLARFALFFGGGGDENRGGGGLGLLFAWILGPIAGSDHPDGRLSIPRVPGGRVRGVPLPRSRRPRRSAAQARRDRPAGAGAGDRGTLRGPPVHREPAHGPTGGRFLAPVLHPPADRGPHRPPAGHRTQPGYADRLS
jgi:hypothetical protein